MNQMRVIYNKEEDQMELYTRGPKEDWALFRAYPCKASADNPEGPTNFVHFSAMFDVATLAAKGYEVV